MFTLRIPTQDMQHTHATLNISARRLPPSKHDQCDKYNSPRPFHTLNNPELVIFKPGVPRIFLVTHILPSCQSGTRFNSIIAERLPGEAEFSTELRPQHIYVLAIIASFIYARDVYTMHGGLAQLVILRMRHLRGTCWPTPCSYHDACILHSIILYSTASV